jgi:tetratricopeptide (TPR) repeat protein
VALNPNSSWPLQNLFFNYQMQRQFDAAAKTVDRALAIDPKSFGLWGLKSRLAIASRGDMSVADEAIAKFVKSAKNDVQWKKEFPAELLTELTLGEAGLRMLQRRFDLVLKVLKELPEKQNPSKPHGIITALTMEGFAYEQQGQAEAARESFLKARQLAEAAVAEEPNDASRHAMLAQVLARLGEKDAAIAEGLKAVELLPISVDAFEGPQIKTVLAEVYAITGENSKAIEVLDELLGRPSDLTVELIKLDPTYDGLRKDPGFQNLLAKYQSRG